MATRQKMLAPTTTITWVPRAGIANFNAPTVAELNAGVNISCAVVAGYTLNATDPNTDNTRSICDKQNVDTPTTNKYEGNLTFFRDAFVADIVGVYGKAFQLFKQADADGYLVRRFGYDSAAVYATTQDVEVFGFTTDNPTSNDGADNAGAIQFTVPFIPSGDISGIVTL